MRFLFCSDDLEFAICDLVKHHASCAYKLTVAIDAFTAKVFCDLIDDCRSGFVDSCSELPALNGISNGLVGCGNAFV